MAKKTSSISLQENEPPSLKNAVQQLHFILAQASKIEEAPALNSKSELFRQKFFPAVSLTEWNNWRWQLSHRINAKTLTQFFTLSVSEKKALAPKLPLNITPYFASLIDGNNFNDPLRKCVIPVENEFSHSPEEALDPLNEDNCSPVEGIVHRYPDRVLFLATDFCSTNCRYCTRSRVVGHQGKKNYNFSFANWEKGIRYIAEHPQIRDVLISGGDPLTLSDEYLDWLLASLRKIPHLEIIRIGTKAPVVLPQRITPNLMKILKKYHPLWISIHFTHPDEITPECSLALERLSDSGIPLGSQTVLLKDINDNLETMKKLMHKLMFNRVRPYYLYQCDPILGSAHFRTPVEKGIEIIEGLRGHTTGYAVPTYVIDAPGGGGKIPLLPEYYLGRKNKKILLRNYEQKKFYYPVD